MGTISQSTTGGHIPGGVTLRVSALCANDANGLPSIPALIAIVQVPTGTDTNAVTLSDIVWPAVAGLANYTLFVSTQDDLLCAQQLATEQQCAGTLSAGDGSSLSPRLGGDRLEFKRWTFALHPPLRCEESESKRSRASASWRRRDGATCRLYQHDSGERTDSPHGDAGPYQPGGIRDRPPDREHAVREFQHHGI